jgi:hypothetical protein
MSVQALFLSAWFGNNTCSARPDILVDLLLMQEHRSLNQASQHEEEKEQLDSASIQILEHCNMAAPNINT